MVSHSDTISTIYRARTNLIDILESRGYDVSDYNEFSIHDVSVMYQNKQLDLLLTRDTDKKKIFVRYFIDKPLYKTISIYRNHTYTCEIRKAECYDFSCNTKDISVYQTLSIKYIWGIHSNRYDVHIEEYVFGNEC